MTIRSNVLFHPEGINRRPRDPTEECAAELFPPARGEAAIRVLDPASTSWRPGRPTRRWCPPVRDSWRSCRSREQGRAWPHPFPFFDHSSYSARTGDQLRRLWSAGRVGGGLLGAGCGFGFKPPRGPIAPGHVNSFPFASSTGLCGWRSGEGRSRGRRWRGPVAWGMGHGGGAAPEAATARSLPAVAAVL